MIKGWTTIQGTQTTIHPEGVVVEATKAEERELVDPYTFLPNTIYFLELTIHPNARVKSHKLKILLKWNSGHKRFAVEIYDSTKYESDRKLTLLDKEWITEKTGFDILKDKERFVKWIMERANKQHRFYSPIPW